MTDLDLRRVRGYLEQAASCVPERRHPHKEYTVCSAHRNPEDLLGCAMYLLKEVERLRALLNGSE